jgi:hypothetical protein
MMAIFIFVTMTLSLSSMCRCLRHCQNCTVALVACHQAGIVALVVMASLPLMHRDLCCCCHCDCHPHDNGVIAIVDVQASLPALIQSCCPCNNGIFALDPQWHCCLCRDGIVVALKLALLLLLKWHCCHHQYPCPCHLPESWCHCLQCAGIFTIVAMVIVALITMALLSLSMRRCFSAVVELLLSLSLLVIEPVSSPKLRWHCCR